MSARTILKHLYEEGRMTEAQYQKIDRNLKERPHGEWKRTDNRWGVGTWRCTHCDSYYGVDTNYCPTCGARMRKEGEAE